MAIPSPTKILHLHAFFHLTTVTNEVERFPDLASPLASIRVPLMGPSWISVSPFIFNPSRIHV